MICKILFINYYIEKVNVVVEALSRKNIMWVSLAMNLTTMLEEFRDMNFDFKLTNKSIRHGLLK